MKVIKKILLLFLIIIVVIGFILGVRTIYKFYTIQKIYNVVDKNIAKENYYLKTTITTKDKTSVTEAYYKDGIGKLVSDNGIYTWVDGEDAYIVDEANKTIYTTDINKTIGLVSNQMFASYYPGYSKSLTEKILLAGSIQNKIKTVMLNDKKCIMIQTKDKTSVKTVWITKSDYYLEKAKLEFPNGDVIEYDYMLKFNCNGIRDVELPDIKDYTLKTEDDEVVLQ